MSEERVTLSDLTREELERLVVDLMRKSGGSVYLDGPLAEHREGESVHGTMQGSHGADYYRLWLHLDGHLSCEEAAEILDAIDEGEDPIVEADDWGFCGDITYRTAAGHTVVVFNDCGDWDYVDRIKAADGRTWEYEDGTGCTPNSRASNWHPGAPKVWGIPPSGAAADLGVLAQFLASMRCGNHDDA